MNVTDGVPCDKTTSECMTGVQATLPQSEHHEFETERTKRMSTTSKLPNRRHFMRRSLALAGGLWAGLETVASPLRADEGRLGAPNRKLHILVCFSWSFRNIGDIAITPGLLRLLKEHVPGVQVTLIANSHLEEYQDYLGTRFPDVNVLRTPFRSTKSASKEFRRAFEAADFVMYNSGTTLSYGRWERDWDRTIPLALPLSRISIPSGPASMVAWRREHLTSFSTRSQPGSRPSRAEVPSSSTSFLTPLG